MEILKRDQKYHRIFRILSAWGFIEYVEIFEELITREKKASRLFNKNICMFIRDALIEKIWAEMMHIQALAIVLDRDIIGNQV